MWRRTGPLLLAFALLFAACSEREPGRQVAPPRASSTPPPPPQLTVEIVTPPEAHQGYRAQIRVFVRRYELPAPATIRVSFGDGQEWIGWLDASGSASVPHLYKAAGRFQVTVRADLEGTAGGSALTALTVHPRRVLFIQGMNSVSRCPDGDGFSTRAPEWLGDEVARQDGIELVSNAATYFSYSGGWCSGATAAEGAFADYDDSDTCSGIDEVLAPRLKALIDDLAPGKVTIVGHSMGGLIAAYLIASDPQWAAERIASVASFDSPLRGINGLRLGFLGAAGIFDGDCGPLSDAVADLKDDSSVVRVAAGAARIVPFYTADATNAERRTFGRIEAVPSGQTRLDGEVGHIGFGETHSRTWTSAGDEVERKQLFVACALALEGPFCLDG